MCVRRDFALAELCSDRLSSSLGIAILQELFIRLVVGRMIGAVAGDANILSVVRKNFSLNLDVTNLLESIVMP
ncbi:hypothetical protein B7R78_0003525 [Ralstonia solanacearum]|nr:hypothetical protein [Ralstonia solanacearum]MBT1536234.1 hypothetical protein [Ralstonia solanacearum]